MRVADGESILPVPRGDAQRLVGYLALHPGVVRREVLAAALWPAVEQRARRSLSDTLYRVRKQLGDGWLVADVDTIALDGGVTVDIREFDALAASGDLRDVRAAVDMHAGELAPGLYDDWALQHRAARDTALVGALSRLAAANEASGDIQRALLDARRLLLTAPLHEPGHQRYLRLLGRLRRVGEAVAHYESLQRLLADELDVEPLPATTDIVNRMMSERVAHVATPVDQPTRFVGRGEERAAALHAVEAAFEGRGGVLCVEGVAGIGKSRLVGEIVGSAGWRGATVLIGDVQDVPEASPLSALARALGPILSAPLRVQVESILDPMTLRTLGPLHPDWQKSESNRPARDAADRVERALRVLGRAMAGMGTVVLVLDDLHWASSAMWDSLAALVDGFVPNGGLLVAAYRRPDIEDTAGWAVLQSWDRQGHSTHVPIGPLDHRDVRELLGDVDRGTPDEVLALTGGVPFYITLWLQDVAGDGQVDQASMIKQRLDALEPSHRRALDAAAVVGDSIAFRVWVDVVDAAPLELAAIGEQLTRDRWISPTTTGHVFTHDLIRDAVYEQIAPTNRRALHERVAAALATVDPQNTRTRGYHLDRAGLALQAVAAYREAGGTQRAASALNGALEVWGRALELLPRRLRRERLDLCLDFADASDVIGGRPDQTAVISEAIIIARELGDEPALSRALLLAGSAAVRAGNAEEGERILTEARELAARLDDRHSLSDAIYRMADLLSHTGRWPEGQRQFLAALDLVEQEHDPWLHGRVLRGLAISAVRMGRPADAVQWVERALSVHRAAGDTTSELISATNVPLALLTAYYELGAWDHMVDTAQRILPPARQLGDPVALGIIHQNLSLAALAVGDRTRADALVTEAESFFARADRKRLVVVAINTRGLIADDDGRVDQALALYQTTIEKAREIDASTEVAYASHDLGALLLAMERPDDAIPLLRTSAEHWARSGHALLQAKSEAVLGRALLATQRPRDRIVALAESGLRLLRTGGAAGEQPQAWLWSLFRLLVDLGRETEAADVLQAARDELTRQAANIADPEQRRGFFEMVPLNRAIMDAIDARSTIDSVMVVQLARTTAPLGRTLRPDERVEVHWTLHAADDAAFTDGIARRRHRLRRLLDEAASAGAAPTDDDLGSALGVSRRTILRDMTSFGDEAVPATTRRRRRSIDAG